LACISREISPISSKKIVPPFAGWFAFLHLWAGERALLVSK
jgi:hypothetical protein